MRKKRRLARALAPIVVRIYLNIETLGVNHIYKKTEESLLVISYFPHFG